MIVGTPVLFTCGIGQGQRLAFVESDYPTGSIVREYGGGSFFVQKKRVPADDRVPYGLTQIRRIIA